ncbi:MAG: protease inhibitor I42 family protein [Gaiellaceae bacterium]
MKRVRREHRGSSARCALFALAAILLLIAPSFASGAIAGRTTTVGIAWNGKEIKLNSGDTLVVRLAGNATTGFRWSIVSRPKALRLVRSTYLTSPPGRIGQGGTFSFRLSALGGRGTLKLAYRRPWENGKPPAQSFSIEVQVKR